MELGDAEPGHEQRNVLMVEDADFSPLRQGHLEGDLWRVLIRRELNHSRHAARISTNGRRVDLLSEEFLAELPG